MERSFEDIFLTALVTSLEKTAADIITEGKPGPTKTLDVSGKGPLAMKKAPETLAQEGRYSAEQALSAEKGKGIFQKLRESLAGTAKGAKEAVTSAAKTHLGPAAGKVKELWGTPAGKAAIVGVPAAGALTGAALVAALKGKRKKEEAA